MTKSMLRRAAGHAVRANWLVTPDKFLAPDEVAALRASLEANRQEGLSTGDRLAVRNSVMVEVLLGTGLRVSELCALKVADVYLQSGRADVLVRRGKGGKSRLVAISERLAVYLQKYVASVVASAEQLLCSAPLFASERGGHLTRSGAHRVWKAALACAGLPTRWGVHATRHSYAVEVYRQTRDLRLTQKLLGHANVATTTVYANLLDDDVRRGVERVWAPEPLLATRR
jgi:site-specific recombinase XerD